MITGRGMKQFWCIYLKRLNFTLGDKYRQEFWRIHYTLLHESEEAIQILAIYNQKIDNNQYCNIFNVN